MCVMAKSNTVAAAEARETGLPKVAHCVNSQCM